MMRLISMMKRLILGVAALALMLGGVGHAEAGLLFVTNYYSGSVGEYNTSDGSAVNASLVTGLSGPIGVTLDGNGHLFVATQVDGTVREYNTSNGSTVNASLITGINSATGLALDGNGHLFTNAFAGGGEYNASDGSAVNANLIAGLSGPVEVALDGNGHLFVSNYHADTVGEYNISDGSAVNANLITGLAGPEYLALQPTDTPIPSTLVMSSILFGMFGMVWSYRRLINSPLKRNAMMKFTRLFSGFVLATLGILSVPATGHCSLITNGSFEDNTTFHGGNHIAGDGTMQLFPGATNLTGWSVVNANNLDLAWEGPTNTYGIHASDGGYFLDLTGYHDASPYSGVEQMIATTAGAQYTLKFDLGSSTIYNGNGPADIIATAGSTTRNFSFFTGLTNDWHTETLNFTASLSSTVINLTGFSGGNYIGLDNVSVTETLAPVPEPALIVSLTGFAVAAFGLSRLRRRRAMAVEPLRSFRNRVGTISRFDTS